MAITDVESSQYIYPFYPELRILLWEKGKQILALGGAALGGLWFPSDMMPHGLQIVGHFTPQYWAQQGLQDVMLRGADVAGVWPSLAAIAGFAAVAAILALMRFRRFLHDTVTHQNVG